MVRKTAVYPCPDCSKTFSRLEHVHRHRRLKHLGIRPWSCGCGVSYARSDLLARHRRKCPGQESNSTSICPEQSWDIPVPSGSHHQSVELITPLAAPHESLDHLSATACQGAISYQTANIDDLPPNPPMPSEPQLIGTKELNSTSSEILPDQYTQVYRRDVELSCRPSVLNDNQCQFDEDNHDRGGFKKFTEGIMDLGDPVSNFIPNLQKAFFVSEVPESSPFYLNPNIWVLAFLCQRSQGFTIPRIGTLSYYVSRAIRVICPVIPMIHVPTFKTTLITIHLGYALCVAGAASEATEHALAFTEQSLTYKRPLVQNDFILRDKGFNFRFELLQALLTYQFIGMFNRLEAQRIRSINFCQTIVENFRDLGFVEGLRNTPDYVHLALSGEVPLSVGWQMWVTYESQKRTAFLVLISSLKLKGPSQSEIMLAEVDLPLPCHEDLWTARSAKEWAKAAETHALSCLGDNMDPTGRSAENISLMSIVGEQSIPLLSDALTALLNLSSKKQTIIPDIYHVGARQLTVRADRLGNFARTVIHHSRALAPQATVCNRFSSVQRTQEFHPKA